MAQRFEHCRLEGNRIVYLGRAGVFEDRRDRSINPFWAWDALEKEGWELVAVVADKNEHVAYFKRPVER